MYATQNLKIIGKGQVEDGMGGFITTDLEPIEVQGYIDLLSGTDQATAQNAIVQESTHIAILPAWRNDIKANMELVDSDEARYIITYVDNPVNIKHHLELYLTFKE